MAYEITYAYQLLPPWDRGTIFADGKEHGFIGDTWDALVQQLNLIVGVFYKWNKGSKEWHITISNRPGAHEAFLAWFAKEAEPRGGLIVKSKILGLNYRDKSMFAKPGDRFSQGKSGTIDNELESARYDDEAY